MLSYSTTAPYTVYLPGRVYTEAKEWNLHMSMWQSHWTAGKGLVQNSRTRTGGRHTENYKK